MEDKMEDKMESVKLRPMPEAENNSLTTPPAIDDYDENYDPHDHRDLVTPTNNMETLVHLLKCSLGTGILAMPQAFAKAGLITGILATIVVGILVTHCLHMIVRSQYNACKRMQVPLMSYTDAATTAFLYGPKKTQSLSGPAGVTVEIFLVVYQLGICCVYIVFIADNLKKDGHTIKSTISQHLSLMNMLTLLGTNLKRKEVIDPYYEMAVEIHMLIILGPLLAFNLIPNLKLLAPYSALANLLTFLGLGIIVYFLITGKKSNASLDLWGSLETFPLFFGTILFALTAVGVVIALENNMKTPKAFGTPCGVLNTGMTIIVILYVAVGALGYVFCVSECSDSITLDLPKDSPLATSVMIMFAVAIFISYGLHCFVPVQVLWRRFFQARSETSTPIEMRVWRYSLRIGLCLVTFVLAVAVPRLGLFISLFGALCLSALGICFPAIMEACLAYNGQGSTRYLILIKDAILFIIGIIGMVAGTYTALVSIIRSFQPAPAPSHA